MKADPFSFSWLSDFQIDPSAAKYRLMNIRQAFVGILLAFATLTAFAGKPESKGTDPDAILRQLYKLHDAHKGPFFDGRNRSLAERFFTKELAALMVKDACQARRRDWLN